NNTAFAKPSSPLSLVARVSSIDPNRRAVRTNTAADDRLSSHRYASHAVADVAPSSAHTLRASHTATARAIAASLRDRTRSSSRTYSVNSVSVSASGSTPHTPAT